MFVTYWKYRGVVIYFHLIFYIRCLWCVLTWSFWLFDHDSFFLSSVVRPCVKYILEQSCVWFGNMCCFEGNHVFWLPSCLMDPARSQKIWPKPKWTHNILVTHWLLGKPTLCVATTTRLSSIAMGTITTGTLILSAPIIHSPATMSIWHGSHVQSWAIWGWVCVCPHTHAGSAYKHETHSYLQHQIHNNKAHWCTVR